MRFLLNFSRFGLCGRGIVTYSGKGGTVLVKTYNTASFLASTERQNSRIFTQQAEIFCLDLFGTDIV
jgi:hypothetical protein